MRALLEYQTTLTSHEPGPRALYLISERKTPAPYKGGLISVVVLFVWRGRVVLLVWREEEEVGPRRVVRR